MKIKSRGEQHRRDFRWVGKCEFCGHEQEEHNGYDDRNYYDNVIPDIECEKCGKSTNSEGGTIDKIQPKYPEGFQI